MHKNFPRMIGFLAACGTFVLWSILHFYNPYSNGPAETDAIFRTLIMLVLPACLAIPAALARKPSLMIIAFIWSLPVSLYLAMTPSIFKWFAASSLLYLISALLMIRQIKADR
ncbi:hypothetical protein AB6A23_18580 [Paenibacillus tarimensis]